MNEAKANNKRKEQLTSESLEDDAAFLAAGVVGFAAAGLAGVFFAGSSSESESLDEAAAFFAAAGVAGFAAAALAGVFTTGSS